MALPYLPDQEIEPMFHRLERQAPTPTLQEFSQYVKSTWIESRIWPTSSWSVFMQSVRTNNDLEGWHRGLNSRASGKSGLPFYLLVKFLYREARLTSLQMRLVSERKLKRIQRRQFRNLQTKIFNLWEEFRNGERSAKQLLSAISYLIAPSQWRYQTKIRLEFETETRYIWIAFSFSLKTFKIDFQRGGCH